MTDITEQQLRALESIKHYIALAEQTLATAGLPYAGSYENERG